MLTSDRMVALVLWAGATVAVSVKARHGLLGEKAERFFEDFRRSKSQQRHLCSDVCDDCVCLTLNEPIASRIE